MNVRTSFFVCLSHKPIVLMTFMILLIDIFHAEEINDK